MEKIFQITLDAKAIWGSKILCKICGVPLNMDIAYCCQNENGVTPTDLAWGHHLEQLASLSEKEKFKYVARFLLKDE